MGVRFKRNCGATSVGEYKTFRSDEGLKLETSALELFTVANLSFQLSC